MLSLQEAIGADYTAMMAQLDALLAQQKALLTSISPPPPGVDGDTSAVRACLQCFHLPLSSKWCRFSHLHSCLHLSSHSLESCNLHQETVARPFRL